MGYDLTRYIFFCVLGGSVVVVWNVNIKIIKSAQRHNVIRQAETVLTHFLALWGSCSFFITLFQSAEIQGGIDRTFTFCNKAKELYIHSFFVQDMTTWIVCKYATHFGTSERDCMYVSMQHSLGLARGNVCIKPLSQ